MNSSSIRSIGIPAFAGWLSARLLVGVAFLCARWLDAKSSFGARSRLDDGLFAWDGGWYRSIAANGYHADGEDLRFAPLFAWAGRIVGYPFGNSPDIGLLVVANVAALAAAWMSIVYWLELKQTESGSDESRQVAFGISFALALWPASFVLVFAYAESLLLVVTLAAALLARRGRWLAVVPFAFASGAIRPTGLALVVLLGGIAWQQRATIRRAGDVVATCVAIGGPVAGFGLHLATAKAVAGDWWAPISIQSPLRGDFVDPFSRLVRGAGDLLADDPWGDGLHFPFAIAVIALVVLVAREMPWPEALFSALVILVALSADNWNSLERYALSAFPIFIAAGVALARQRLLIPAYVLASGAALTALTVLAWSGRYVP